MQPKTIRRLRQLKIWRLFAVLFLFLVPKPALATISFSQCEEELSKYCDKKQYRSKQDKESCILAKQNQFTNECVIKLLGIQVSTAQTPNANTNSKTITNKVSEQKDNKIIQEQQHTIANLNSLLLTSNCLPDISKWCKTKVKKGKTMLKEDEKTCIKKLVKKERFLTMNCRGILLNILTNSNDKQYQIHNINNIAVTHEQILKKAQADNNMAIYDDENSIEKEFKMIVRRIQAKLPIKYSKIPDLRCNPYDEADYEIQADGANIAKRCIEEFKEKYATLRQQLTEDEYFDFREQYFIQKGYRIPPTGKKK